MKLLRRTPTAGQRHPSPLLRLVPGLLLLLLISRPAAASASTVVTHLPGFDGPLPFHLETGYVGVEEETGAELFYYLVESERSPGADPVLLWLTGGPRCSGFSAFAFEVGPVKFVLAPYDGGLPQLVYNPLSWTKMASIIFLDSPVSSGFSYARDPKGCDDVGDYSSSLQVQRFLNKGYLVGNPMTDPKFDRNFQVQAAHGFGIISDQIYEAAMRNCKGDYINHVNQMCAEVLQTVKSLISEILDAHILYKKCVFSAPKPTNDATARKNLLEESIELNEAPGRPAIDCLTYGYYLSYFWMNNNMTRDALGVKQGTVGEWVRCKRELPYKFDMPSSIPYHLNLTMRGYRALVYSGDHDLQVPQLSTQAWIRSLNFSIVSDWRAWHLDGQAAGFTMGYANNLTFATVKSSWS
uniref:Serine carboxypeptidase-like 19 n=1 Tax=Aegilops tauschii subsp. strangulata TaxID=200361 RepID=A0A453QTB4_AEGTS